MKQFSMKHFDNYTLDECGYKILEEAAELYAAWQELYKDDCKCGSCDLANTLFTEGCPDFVSLGDELYDVLQVCVNISVLVDDTNSYDGRAMMKEIDKKFMQWFLSHVAYVHALIRMYDGSERDQAMVRVFVRRVVSDVMDIAHAYGVDMSKAAERGTKRNIERGRISEDN